MKTIRLIKQKSALYAYLQIDNNVPRRFRIDTKKKSSISLGTAQLLFVNNPMVNEMNKQLIQNARILTAEPLLLKSYKSECILFGKSFEFCFPISTDAKAEDVIGKDMLQKFSGICIEGDELVFDDGKSRSVCNEIYTFRQYEATNIIDTMSHRYDDLRREYRGVFKAHQSDELLQMMDMALDNAMFYLKENKFAEAEYILKRIDSLFWKKIEFDCNCSTPYHYSSTGKFLYLRGMISLERSLTSIGESKVNSYREQAFSELLKASYFFLPESQIAQKIGGAVQCLRRQIVTQMLNK